MINSIGIIGSILPMLICIALALLGLDIVPAARGKIKNGKKIAFIYVAAAGLLLLSMIIPLFRGISIGGSGNGGDKDDGYYGSSVVFEKEGKRAGNAIALSAGQTVNGYFEYVEEEGDKVWFEIEPYTSGTYVFTHTASNGQKISVNETKSKSIAESYDGMVMVSLEADEKYYVIVEMVNGSDSEFALSANYPNNSQLQNNESLYCEMGSGVNEKWYYVQPTESGYYELRVTCDGSYNNGNNTVKLYDGTSLIAEGNFGDVVTAELTANKTYYVRLTRESTDYYLDMNVSFYYNERLSAPLAKLGSNNVVYDYESTIAYFKFKPETDGYYLIRHDNYYDDLLFTISGASTGYQVDADWIEDDEYFIIDASSLSNEETYSIEIQNIAQSFNFYIEKINEVEIDGEGTSFSLEDKSTASAWFRIAPTTGGRYIIAHDSDVHSLSMKFYNTSTPSTDNAAETATGTFPHGMISRTLNVGSVYYVCVTSENGGAVSGVKLYTIKDVDYGATSMTVGNNYYNYFNSETGENWYKITTTQAGIYKFYYTSSYNYYIDVYTINGFEKTHLNADDNSDGEVSLELESGMTYYVSIKPQSNSDIYNTVYLYADIDYFASAIEITSDTDTYSSSLVNYNQYFKITPAEDDYYTFALPNTSSSSSYWYLYLYNADDTSSYITYASGYPSGLKLSYALEADTTYYVKVSQSNYSNSTFTLNVSTPTEITPDDIAYSTNLVSYNKMFKFTPETDGYYNIRLANGTDYSYSYSWYLYLYDEDMTQLTYSYGSHAQHCNVYYDLKAEKTYYLKVNFESSSTAGFDITITSPATLTTTESVSTALVNKERYIMFAPTESNYYTFTFSNTSSLSTWYAYLYKASNMGSSLIYTSGSDISANSLTYLLTAGEVYYLYINHSNTDGLSITASVEAIGETLTASGTSAQLGADNKKYFKFTPETDGYYKISLSNGSSTSYYWNQNLYDDQGTQLDYASSYGTAGNYVEYVLDSDETYFIVVSMTNGEGYSFTVNYTTSHVTLTESGASAELDSGYKYFMFTPTETDYYSFTIPSADYSSSWSVYLYSEKDVNYNISADSGYYYDCKVEGILKAGETYYIRVYNSYSSYADFSVSVTSGSTEASVGSNSNYLSNSYNYYKFTPTASDIYTISLSSSYSSSTWYLYLYSEDDTSTYLKYDSGYYASDCTFKVTLEADKTYFIKIYHSSYSSAYVTMSISALNATELAVGDTHTVSVNASNPYAYYYFTATESGSYTFYSTTTDYTDTYCTLYNANMSSITSADSGGENGNFSITYDLVEGETYIFEARMWNTSDSGSFDVCFVENAD